jgi:hypothetical protein
MRQWRARAGNWRSCWTGCRGIGRRWKGPQMKTGPVLPPAPSQVPAGVSRPRSVPNRVLLEQAPAGPDPGWSKASSSPSLRTSTEQAPLPPCGRLSGEPATIHERLSGKPATIRSGVHPASRRLSLRHPSGKPAIVPCGSSPPGEPGFPTIGSSPGEPFDFPPVVPSSKLSGRPFAIPLPEGSGFAGLRKSGFGLGFPRRLALLPGCPARASLISFPKDLDQIGTGGVSEGSCRCRPVFLDRERPTWPAQPIRTNGNPGFEPVDNGDNGDKSAESAPAQSAASSRCFRLLASSWPRRTDS